MASNMAEKPFLYFDKVFTRRRKRSSFSASQDSEFVLPGFRRDQMLKHRSCIVHLLSFKHGEKATRRQAELIRDEYGTAYCFFNSIPHGKRSRKSKRADRVPFPADMSSDPVSSQARNTNSNSVPVQSTNRSTNSVLIQAANTSSDPAPFQATDTIYDPAEFLVTSTNSVPFQATNMSSNSFGDHLERLWSTFPGDRLAQFTYLECLWFGMYRQAYQRAKVISWIKKKNIFTRTYVFVPICCWSHWNLLVLCHFGKSLDSEKPCMILLDSLHMADPKRLEWEIRKFVLDIYKEEGISDRRVSQIPLLIPKVPQQRNKECGFFVLYFIKKFMEAAPEIIADGDTSFIKKNWFTREELDGFCIALEEESKAQKELEASIPKEMLVQESSREGNVIVIND